MRAINYDFIIVGSGAGGSTLVWELTKKVQKGIDFLIKRDLELGDIIFHF